MIHPLSQTKQALRLSRSCNTLSVLELASLATSPYPEALFRKNKIISQVLQTVSQKIGGFPKVIMDCLQCASRHAHVCYETPAQRPNREVVSRQALRPSAFFSEIAGRRLLVACLSVVASNRCPPMACLRLQSTCALCPMLLLPLLLLQASPCQGQRDVCIVGSGMAGASVAYFLREYSQEPLALSIFEARDRVGGRMAVVDLEGDTFEAGASVIHPKNEHAARFVELLGLNRNTDDDDESFGIWDGSHFVFQTARAGDTFFSKTITQIMNTLSILWRYGTSLWKMQTYVNAMLGKWVEFYNEDRPAFDSVEGMLKSVNLYDSTQYTVEELLQNAGLSQLLIDELITVTMRINYGQNVSISGLAGGVSLAGAQGGLWAVDGGNWQLAEGLIHYSNASLSLNHEVVSVTAVDGKYEVGSEGGAVTCDAVVLATSLDESKILFTPPVHLVKRHMQHTFTTFVRGLLNSTYFGSTSESIPKLIGTKEDPNIPFSSISILKEYNATDKAYKVFSRAPLSDQLLNLLFSIHRTTIRLDWAAYPHYTAPEKFSPYVLDAQHLYYINSFENAASAIETAAVSAQNVARLLLFRLSGEPLRTRPCGVRKETPVDDL